MTSSLPVWLPSYKSFFFLSLSFSFLLCFPLIQMCLTQVMFSHPCRVLDCFFNKATLLVVLPSLLFEHPLPD